MPSLLRINWQMRSTCINATVLTVQQKNRQRVSDNAKLFHLPSEEDLRAAFAKRKIGDERNNWLYNYDPINVTLIYRRPDHHLNQEQVSRTAFRSCPLTECRAAPDWVRQGLRMRCGDFDRWRDERAQSFGRHHTDDLRRHAANGVRLINHHQPAGMAHALQNGL